MSEYSSYTPGTPLTLTLCLEEDSILLSEAVLEALGHPRQVQMKNCSLVERSLRNLLFHQTSRE